MPSQSPRYIMRNANLFIDRENYVGQASEIGFGKLERKMEEVFNGGQEMPIEVPMGYEMPENSFKMTGFDPTVLKLFGLTIGVETEIMAVGARGQRYRRDIVGDGLHARSVQVHHTRRAHARRQNRGRV